MKTCISLLNTASVDELARIKGLDNKRARDIVSYRKQHGEFKSWEDLKHVPGYSEEFANALKKSGVCTF